MTGVGAGDPAGTATDTATDTAAGTDAVPAGRRGLLCSPDELRTLFLFERFTDEQLAWLCERGRVEEFEPGLIYAEGAPASDFYVLLNGSVVISHRSGPEDIEMTRTSTRGVYAGAFQAYLGERVPQRYLGSFHATEPSRFFVLSAVDFASIIHDWFPMAEHLLEGLFFGSQEVDQVIGTRDRLTALGTLSAGLTHELNNPAAAMVRSVSTMRERKGLARAALRRLAGSAQVADLDALARLQEEALAARDKGPELSPLAASDLEDELGDWLEERDVDHGWEIAPILVQAGLGTAWLEEVAAAVPSAVLADAVLWLTHGIESELLLEEIDNASTRIFALVDAARQYSQLDRAPDGVVDVHDLLDSTLMVLSSKIGPDITVVRDYDRELPAVHAYAAELNQVWTNLIDNALYAMAEQGTLTITTRSDGDHVVVEFRDTGSGVPEDIRARIFEPFFTSKPVGEGTGLGLDISRRIVVQRHRGDLSVESAPGDTRFRVRLPIEQPA